MKYVIIGNSTAAIGTIEGIRSVDKKGDITVISKEKYHTYSRPLISYYLNGKTDVQKMKYRKEEFYKENKINFLKDVEVVKIDKELNKVLLSNGKEESYDKLMIATGSVPFVPHFLGIETVKKAHTFYTLDDALELEKELNEDKKVLIVGAGLIGLKCAEGILEKVKEVTVTDISNKILSSILDDESSLQVKDFLQKKGITFKLSSEISSFDNNKAVFKDNSIEEFDILVVAIGVKSNISLAKNAGLITNKGIVINEYMQTSDTNIYSAGDCSEGYDMLLNSNRVLALLPNAYMQGETAGKNMAGQNASYETGMPMNAIGFFGMHIVSAGIYEGESIIKKTPSSYKRLFFENNNLKGFIIVGDCGRAGIYTFLIREKIPLTEIDFNLIIDKPQLIALNNRILNKKLGESL